MMEDKKQGEPVAWMFQHEETGRIMFVEAQQLEYGFEEGNPRLKKITPLYTTPPAAQREWVGLPTVVILDIYAETLKEHRGGSMPDGQIAFAKAIEQALKERNT
jgi:hypothetical protein